jgi:hypothetical protein
MRVTVILLAVLTLAGCGGTEWDGAWETADGEEVEEAIVSSGTGCPNEDTVLLHLGWPLGTPQLKGPARQYVRDPNPNHLGGIEGFVADADLPRSARFSGYRRGDVELWVGDDADEFVYLVADDHVERWPRNPVPSGCG